MDSEDDRLNPEDLALVSLIADVIRQSIVDDLLAGNDACCFTTEQYRAGHELYYGQPGPKTPHQQIPCEPDARLMAVARSWLRDLIEDLEEARAERDRLRAVLEEIRQESRQLTPDGSHIAALVNSVLSED